MALNQSTTVSDPKGDTGLPQQVINEQLSGIGGRRGQSARSAMLYDRLPSGGVDIFLVITRQKVTLGEFRAAIKQSFTTAEDGIFLDGGASTQLNSREAQFTTTRRIPQIVALKA